MGRDGVVIHMILPEAPTAENVRKIEPAGDPLLSDEPTIELVARARGGDRPAMEALLQRCLPQLMRWAYGCLTDAALWRLEYGVFVHAVSCNAPCDHDSFK